MNTELRTQPALMVESPTPSRNGSHPDEWLPVDTIMQSFSRGEVGAAELLAALQREHVRFDHTERAWYLRRGHHWALDRTGAVRLYVYNDVASQYAYAAAELTKLGTEAAKAKADDLWSRAGSLRYRNKINNVLDEAARLPSLAMTGDEWDADPYLLGCANGIVNLRDGSFRPSEPNDFIRMVAPVEWHDLFEQAPRWEQFLDEIFAHDVELIDFLQRLLGYGITGLTTEHVLPVLYGEGRNGKDTQLEALAYTLGPLATPVSVDVLLDAKHDSGAATPHLYSLRGRRLVWVSETNEGARLNAGQVKMITGGGSIVARPLHGNPITYKPSHLLLLITNHKPHVNADDYALWKRLHLIPFTQAFLDEPNGPNEHERDPYLLDKLRVEAPGILAWLVRGCLAWQAEGLKPPQTVLAATKQYHDEEDTIEEFIAERCVAAATAETKASALYADYAEWAGKDRMSKTAFGRRMAKRFSKERVNRGIVYRGVGLSATHPDEPV